MGNSLLKSAVSLVLLSSCLTAKKAEKQLDKINDKFPDQLGQVCDNRLLRDSVIDTIERVEYDFIEVLCDTVTQKETSVKYAVKVKYRTITVTVKDTVTVNSLQRQLDKCNQDHNKAKKVIKESQTNNFNVILLIALLILNILFAWKSQNSARQKAPNVKG